MIIETQSGDILDIEDYGLKRMFHYIPSLTIKHSTVDIPGRGSVVLDTTFDQRTITVDILFQVRSIHAYYLLRDQLNGIFARGDFFYIIFKREAYQRWKVNIAEGFQLPPHPVAGRFELKFKTVKKYAESLATTSSAKEWDENVWGWNGAISWDDDIKYSFDTQTFVVKNRGTAPLMMLEDLDYTIKVKATGGPLTLRNKTTGQSFIFRSTLSSNNELVLRGSRVLLNGASVFTQSNGQEIDLLPGDNEFEVTGATVNSVIFDFRFPFK